MSTYTGHCYGTLNQIQASEHGFPHSEALKIEAITNISIYFSMITNLSLVFRSLLFSIITV